MNILTKLKRLPVIQAIYKNLFQFVGFFPANENLIMFESFLGKQYSCNPRAIYEYLKDHYPDYQLYWSVDPRFTAPFEEKGIPYVKRFSLKWLWLMARAKCWVTNSRMPLWIPKPKHTTYLQTWHGTPLKKLANDMEEVHMHGTATEKYKRDFYKESRNWDYLISPNSYSTKIFRRAFQYDNEIIESGYPRNDILHIENKAVLSNQIKLKLGIPLDKKVLLYAPTWRDNQFYPDGKYKFDLQLDLSMLREALGDEYVIILRMHYLVAENFDLTPYQEFAFDFSKYEDIRELYLVSDILITDYSSVFFDFANLKRPIIFYVYDIDVYRDELRGFYFDLEKKAPGPLMNTTDEVIKAIKLYSSSSVPPENYEEFYQEFCSLENGNSAQRVINHIFPL